MQGGPDLGDWLVERAASRWCRRCRRWPRCGRRPRCARPPADPGRRGVPGRSWPTGWRASGTEVWNTYGPTEATVVACAARLTGDGPVRIGLPLAGWDLAVVDPESGEPVAWGEEGELVIGGAGVARYLDPVKDAERFRAAAQHWAGTAAYRSGDLVRADPEGLVFLGRADTQVKIRGYRIELSEIESVLLQLPGIAQAAVTTHEPRPGLVELVGLLQHRRPADAVDEPQILERAAPPAARRTWCRRYLERAAGHAGHTERQGRPQAPARPGRRPRSVSAGQPRRAGHGRREGARGDPGRDPRPASRSPWTATSSTTSARTRCSSRTSARRCDSAPSLPPLSPPRTSTCTRRSADLAATPSAGRAAGRAAAVRPPAARAAPRGRHAPLHRSAGLLQSLVLLGAVAATGADPR